MYRCRKRVSDHELRLRNIPEDYIKRTTRRDLYYELVDFLERERLDIDDFLLRFTSTRLQAPAPFGHATEYVTEYTLTAVPLADAREIIGGR